MAEFEAIKFWLALKDQEPELALLALILVTIVVGLVIGYKLTRGNNEAIGETKEEVVNLIDETKEQTKIMRDMVHLLSKSTDRAHNRIDTVEKVQDYHSHEIQALKKHIQPENHFE